MKHSTIIHSEQGGKTAKSYNVHKFTPNIKKSFIQQSPKPNPFIPDLYNPRYGFRTHSTIKKSDIEQSHGTTKQELKQKIKKLLSKKSDIEAAVKGLEEASVQKNKRGININLFDVFFLFNNRTKVI